MRVGGAQMELGVSIHRAHHSQRSFTAERPRRAPQTLRCTAAPPPRPLPKSQPLAFKSSGHGKGGGGAHFGRASTAAAARPGRWGLCSPRRWCLRRVAAAGSARIAPCSARRSCCREGGASGTRTRRRALCACRPAAAAGQSRCATPIDTRPAARSAARSSFGCAKEHQKSRTLLSKKMASPFWTCTLTASSGVGASGSSDGSARVLEPSGFRRLCLCEPAPRGQRWSEAPSAVAQKEHQGHAPGMTWKPVPSEVASERK